MKKHKFVRLASLLVLLLLAAGVGLFLRHVGATAADEQEEKLLGTLSARYEAASPGAISSGNGVL